MGPLPAALRPAWSGSSFLVYAGAFTVLVSLGVLLGTLGDMHGSTALVAWSAVVLAILVALAVAASRSGRPVVAGLSGFVAVAVVMIGLTTPGLMRPALCQSEMRSSPKETVGFN